MKKKDKAVISLNHLLYLGTLSMVGMTVVVAIILSSASVYADDVVTTTSVTVSASCTFTSGGGSFSDTILGGHISVINGSAITTSCNDPSGYSIYAIGYSNDSYTNTDLIGTNTGATIKTDGTNSYWKMMVTPGNNATLDSTTGFDTYREIPDSYTRVAYYANNTTAGTITPSYQVSVSASQPADAYVGKVKYVLVNPNNAAAPELPSFCDTHACMQDQTSSTLAAMIPNVGDTITLYDKRDEKAYTVGKLADGKYWMLEPLNLAGGTTLTSADTDVTDTYISGFTEGNNLTKTGNSITLPASVTKNSSNANLTDSTQFSDGANAYVFNSGNNTSTCNSSTPCNSYYSWIAATLGGKQANGSTNETRNGYNVAASICPKGWRLPTSTTSNASPTSNNNWKTGDWYALATAYGTNLESSYQQSAATFYNNAGPGTTPNFLLAGNYGSGSFGYGGSYGYYWSATSYNSTYAYTLTFNSGLVYSAAGGNRKYGILVRCVLSE